MGSCHGYDGAPGRPMTEGEESLLYTTAGSIALVPVTGGLSLLLSSGKGIQVVVQGQQVGRAIVSAGQARVQAGVSAAQSTALKWSPAIGAAASDPVIQQNALDFVEGASLQGAPPMTPAGGAGYTARWVWDQIKDLN